MITVKYADIVNLVDTVADPEEIHIHAHYGGRGMYGKTCLGISGRLPGYTAFVAALVERVLDEDDRLADGSPLAEFRDVIDRVSTDGMGTDTIFYWRGVQVSGGEDEEDE